MLSEETEVFCHSFSNYGPTGTACATIILLCGYNARSCVQATQFSRCWWFQGILTNNFLGSCTSGRLLVKVVSTSSPCDCSLDFEVCREKSRGSSFRSSRRFPRVILFGVPIVTDLGFPRFFTTRPSVRKSGIQTRSPGDSCSPSTILCL